MKVWLKETWSMTSNDRLFATPKYFVIKGLRNHVSTTRYNMHVGLCYKKSFSN